MNLKKLLTSIIFFLLIVSCSQEKSENYETHKATISLPGYVSWELGTVQDVGSIHMYSAAKHATYSYTTSDYYFTGSFLTHYIYEPEVGFVGIDTAVVIIERENSNIYHTFEITVEAPDLMDQIISYPDAY